MAGDRGRLTGTVDGARLIFDVHNAGGGAWAFSSSLGTVLAWVAIPPLVLWLLWMLSRPRHGALTAASRELPAPRPPAHGTRSAPDQERSVGRS